MSLCDLEGGGLNQHHHIQAALKLPALLGL